MGSGNSKKNEPQVSEEPAAGHAEESLSIEAEKAAIKDQANGKSVNKQPLKAASEGQTHRPAGNGSDPENEYRGEKSLDDQESDEKTLQNEKKSVNEGETGDVNHELKEKRDAMDELFNEISGVVDLDEEVAVDREQTKEKHCHEHTTKVMVPEESPAVEDEKQKRELPATKEPVEIDLEDELIALETSIGGEVDNGTVASPSAVVSGENRRREPMSVAVNRDEEREIDEGIRTKEELIEVFTEDDIPFSARSGKGTDRGEKRFDTVTTAKAPEAATEFHVVGSIEVSEVKGGIASPQKSTEVVNLVTLENERLLASHVEKQMNETDENLMNEILQEVEV